MVCIKLGGWNRVAGEEDDRETRHPILDGVYTIALIDPEAPGGYVMVTFDECHPEDFYWIDRFRPLISGSLHEDVAQFRELLNEKRDDGFVEIPHHGVVNA